MLDIQTAHLLAYGKIAMDTIDILFISHIQNLIKQGLIHSVLKQGCFQCTWKLTQLRFENLTAGMTAQQIHKYILIGLIGSEEMFKGFLSYVWIAVFKKLLIRSIV